MVVEGVCLLDVLIGRFTFLHSRGTWLAFSSTALCQLSEFKSELGFEFNSILFLESKKFTVRG